MTTPLPEFLGHTIVFWTALTAIGTIAIALITLGLVWGGLYQVRAVRKENQKAATLAQCMAYESNPVVAQAARTLRTALDSGSLESYPENFRCDLVLLFNYLDGIAISRRIKRQASPLSNSCAGASFPAG